MNNNAFYFLYQYSLSNIYLFYLFTQKHKVFKPIFSTLIKKYIFFNFHTSDIETIILLLWNIII